MNAAKDSTELVAKLRAYHHSAQKKADKQHLSGYVLVLEVMGIIFLLLSGCYSYSLAEFASSSQLVLVLNNTQAC